MKVTAIVSQTWLALFLIVVFAVIGFATLESMKPADKSNFCLIDSDCACGKDAKGECFYGNSQYVNTSEQCPDFCTGFGGNLEIRCINNGCRQVQTGGSAPKGSPSPECSRDSDCGTGGCSNQVCGKKDKVQGIVTTCEYRTEYGCLKQTSCGCVSGKCEWKKTQEYQDCMKKLGE